MSKILLLHDLKEKDLARDLKDLLETIGAEIYTIPLSPNLGSTLEDKENHYIQQSDGAIFLITPGAERMGGTYPSPSVSVEIGQIKERFKSKPGHIIYLQEEGCSSPTIHQQAFIGFNRKDIRSIIEALTFLIRDLKKVSLLASKSRKDFDTNWSKDYEGIKARVYTEWPKTALKTESQILIYYSCATHGLDLKEKETFDMYGRNGRSFYCCELCKDGGGEYRKFSVERIQQVKSLATSDYRKWLESKLKEI